ncbi:MAG: pyruvate dehydrogenase complex dihydrolipoamide acetyltransferase [Magnetovibrio sp.]|nr:pyruvate dehydrogenase complex dihydrolipoamide acetyltransferase [Magnetovibrio sp.]|tara:strand:+ start:335 stop:1645 length:1311 start_codon:yes stop_codon:yes gene_type:complete
MPIQILMPALSPTMTEGTLVKWLKAEGDMIESGDAICEIETDKATMEVEAADEGVLGKILVAEGTDNVAVNHTIAILLEEGEDPIEIKNFTIPAAPISETKEEVSTIETLPIPHKTEQIAQKMLAKPSHESKRIFASPLAKRIAEQNGIDINSVVGSGPNGRIVKRDIEMTVSAGINSASPQVKIGDTVALTPTVPTFSKNDPVFENMPAFKAISNTAIRKIIATRLTDSARNIPHFNITIEADLEGLLSVRLDLNSTENTENRISINDLIIKAVAVALKRHPNCNAAYTDEAILQFERVDISIAVAIKGGLITPIIKDAGSKGLATISSEVKDLVTKARSGTLAPEEFQGGTFTISNLGMFGVKSFNSIINAPQGGILSVGAGEERAVVHNGKVLVRNIISLTMAVDHRCIDGASAAIFMKEVKSIIETPVQLML